MIIATAGHIDHGKTSLVQAITGVDTDRLPEEKKRGMSIDLGFAFSDSCVSIDGYPLCLFPPSGIAQVVAYESIQTEMALLGDETN